MQSCSTKKYLMAGRLVNLMAGVIDWMARAFAVKGHIRFSVLQHRPVWVTRGDIMVKYGLTFEQLISLFKARGLVGEDHAMSRSVSLLYRTGVKPEDKKQLFREAVKEDLNLDKILGFLSPDEKAEKREFCKRYFWI